jgi:hypothetical protein
VNLKNLILFVAVFSLMSCVKRTTTDPVPTMTFASFVPVDENLAYMTVNYTDGDGDIFFEKGIKDNNFFAWFYYKDTDGSFKEALQPIVIVRPPLADTTIYQNKPLGYTVERPSELSKDQPIKGQITITMTGWRPDSKYKNFKYKIYMVDQKDHKTEEIMTPELASPF